MKIFFDGGCRPNPGTIETAVVGAGQSEIVRNAGYGTSLDADWLALIHALKFARSLKTISAGSEPIVLLGDAANVIGQATGHTKCRGASRHHLDLVRQLAADLGQPRIRHIRRSQNLAGIALAKLHER